MTKELDKLIQDVQISGTGYEEPKYNSFDAPVPGESLTNICQVYRTLFISTAVYTGRAVEF